MKQKTKKKLNDVTPEEWNSVAPYKPDNVNNPPHYNKGDIECIDGIEAMLTGEEYIGYLRGNSLKYRWRFRYKNGIEDLQKAAWYENRLMEFLAKERK
jgi:hypothetical protein